MLFSESCQEFIIEYEEEEARKTTSTILLQYIFYQ